MSQTTRFALSIISFSLYFRLSSCGDLLIELFLNSDNILFKITTSYLFPTFFQECSDVFNESQDDILTSILTTITNLPRVRIT